MNRTGHPFLALAAATLALGFAFWLVTSTTGAPDDTQPVATLRPESLNEPGAPREP